MTNTLRQIILDFARIYKLCTKLCEQKSRITPPKQKNLFEIFLGGPSGRFCFAKSGIIAVFIFFIISVHADAAEKVFYSKLTGDFWQIWEMNTDGSAQRQVTFSPEDKRYPFWIKSDRRLGYRTSNGEIFTITLDGNNGNNKERLLEQYTPLTDPDYSSAANEIIFTRFIPNAADIGGIWKVNLTNQQTSILSKGQLMSYQPKVSADGQKIVFVKIDAAGQHQLWLMNTDGTDARQMTEGAGLRTLPAISQNADKIIFASNHKNGDYDLYILDVDSMVLKEILTRPGLDTNPRFIRNDERILFVSNHDGERQIWGMSSAGQDIKKLTSGSPSIDPHWVKNIEEGIK